MCILCVISRWSRRTVNILPSFIVPFIIIWALSQVLPPGFRLEVTSPRLACLAVLLSSLGWYEVLMPRLSSWRARRSALLRERKRIEAQEAAKWRKEATRRCRNCLAAYKVQTPWGGRFMCTYCGHVSKRPVLEVPRLFPQPTGSGTPGTSFAGGQLVNGAAVQYLKSAGPGSREVGSWPFASERGCTWFGSSWPFGLCAREVRLRGARPSFEESTTGGEKCNTEQSSSGFFLFIWRIFLFVRWLWIKFLVIGQPRKDGSAEGSRSSQRSGDNLDCFHGSRSDRARRKAKEKRQIRLEKELLEAEERKQREEVARLVEERRRQREEKMEVEKESEREAATERDREIRRNRKTERRRKDKAREGVTKQVKDTTKESEQEDAVIKNKTSLEFDGSNASPKWAPIKDVEVERPVRVSRGLMHDRKSRYRGATDNFFKAGLQNYTGISKKGPLSTFKMGTGHMNGWERNMIEGSHARSKYTKSATPVDQSGLNLNPKSDAVTKLSDSAWKTTNAWFKKSEALTEDSPTMKTGMLIKEEGLNLLGDKETVVKPPRPPVGSTAVQPPIAPPSPHIDSLHQLFSSPSIFSPMDLAVDFQTQHEQKLQTDTRNTFLPGHTSFDASRCVTFQTSESFFPPSMPASLQMSLPAQDSLFSPMQLTSGPQIRMGFTCMDIPQPSLPLGPASDLLMNSPAESVTFAATHAVIESNPVSPSSVSIADPTIIDALLLSPNSKPMNTDGIDLQSDKDLLQQQDSPFTLLEDANVAMDGTWDSTRLHDMKLLDSSTWMSNDNYLLQEALQLPCLSTMQLLFDPETQVPQRNLTLLEQAVPKINTYEISQVSNKKSFWSDISALNATVRIWDDSDMHQKMPPEFVDCITQEIMEDPVITADGHSYERSAIEKWLRLHDTSPKTGEVLPPLPNGIGVDKTLRPNHILRGQIIEYKEKLARI